MTGQSTPAGWYPDPQDPRQQRYWDGAAWSEATQFAPGGYGQPGYGQSGYGQPVGYGFAQGVVGQEPAGFWIRFLASLIDSLLIGVPFAILGAIVVSASDDQTSSFNVTYGWNPSVPPWLNLLSTIVSVLYFGFLEGGPSGQTLGKRVCSIKVVDARSYEAGIGVGRAIGRYFVSLISGFVCLIGYLWMLWDPEKQTWHDKAVSAKVVKA